MLDFQTKQHTGAKHTRTIKLKRSTKPDSIHAPLLKLSNREFKIFLMNIVRAIVGRLNNMYELMENYSGETEAIRKIEWKY